jgi:TolB-like protein
VSARGSKQAPWALIVLFAAVPGALAQPAGRDAGHESGLGKKIAVLSLDALGMDPERVGRLEALFRNELERLAGVPGPSRREIERVLRNERKLLRCGGETGCLAAIGDRLGVELVVFGSVAELGDSFVVDIKVVDAATREEVRRIESDPLRGDADELIEAVRVAAYRLLAPERLRGAIAILADIDGARVELDGAVAGQTPLSRPIRNLALGPHRLRVTADGYSPFEEEVEVRFQKTTRVLVRLAGDPDEGQDPALVTAAVAPPPEDRWYQSRWFWLGAGAAAVAVGGVVGWQLARTSVTDCNASPEACR